MCELLQTHFDHSDADLSYTHGWKIGRKNLCFFKKKLKNLKSAIFKRFLGFLFVAEFITYYISFHISALIFFYFILL